MPDDLRVTSITQWFAAEPTVVPDQIAQGLAAVTLLDDDRSKRHLKIARVSVKGRIENLVEVADEADATAVVVAVPTICCRVL